MQPKMFAKLYEAIDKFIEQNCESEDWERADFLMHDNMPLQMAKAAEMVFDATVESNHMAKENAG